MVYQRTKNGVKESGKDPFVLVLKKYTGLKAITKATDTFGFCTGVNPPMGPPFCGQYQDKNGTWLYDTQPVPTAIHKRPGHRYRNKIYVSTLSGAIWLEPVAQIYEYTLNKYGYPMAKSARIVPGGPYWTVTDFVFANSHTLYVVETNPGVPFVPFSGRLSKVTFRKSGGGAHVSRRSGGKNNITQPTGIAIHRNKLYMTDRTFNPSAESGTCDGRILVASFGY